MKNYLILISGPSCTGKTNFAKYLAERINLPLVDKDSIKEILFDDFGWDDREWSKKIGVASYSILYYLIESQLKAGKPFIIESNFKDKIDGPNFQVLQNKYSFDLIQIMFECDGKILLERFKKRSESGERHPGHQDNLNYDEFQGALLKGKNDPLDLNSPIIIVDTTDFEKVDYDKIIEEIKCKIGM